MLNLLLAISRDSPVQDFPVNARNEGDAPDSASKVYAKGTGNPRLLFLLDDRANPVFHEDNLAADLAKLMVPVKVPVSLSAA